MIEVSKQMWATWQYNRNGSLQAARIVVKYGRFDRAEYRGTLHASLTEAREFLEQHGDPDKRYVIAPYYGD